MHIKLFIRHHSDELLQGSAACGVVRGGETRDELKELGSEQDIRFVPAHFGSGSHKDEAAQVFLSTMADVVTDDESAIGPASQDGLVQSQCADHRPDVFRPDLAILEGCRITQLVRKTVPTQI